MACTFSSSVRACLRVVFDIAASSWARFGFCSAILVRTFSYIASDFVAASTPVSCLMEAIPRLRAVPSPLMVDFREMSVVSPLACMKRMSAVEVFIPAVSFARYSDSTTGPSVRERVASRADIFGANIVTRSTWVVSLFSCSSGWSVSSRVRVSANVFSSVKGMLRSSFTL